MKRFLSILLGVSLVMSLSACSLFPAGDEGGEKTTPTKKSSNVDPAEVIKKMETAMQDVEIASYDLTASVDLEAEEGTGSMEFTMSGYSDESNAEELEGFVTLGANFDFDIEDEAVSGDAELDFVYKEAMAYLKLNDLTLEGEEMEAMVEMVKEYVGTWYFMPFEVTASDFEMKDFSKEFSKEFSAGLMEDKELTAEQESAIEELVNNTEWFETTADKGTEKMDGTEVYVFEVSLSKDNAMAFLKEYATILEEEVSDDEWKEAEDALDSFTLEGTMYIGVADNYLYKFEAEVAVDVDEEMAGEAVKMNISLVLTMSGFGETKEVEVPEDSLDIMEIMGMLMGGGDMYGEYDYEAMDDSEWEEWDDTTFEDSTEMDDSEWEDWDFETEEDMVDETLETPVVEEETVTVEE